MDTFSKPIWDLFAEYPEVTDITFDAPPNWYACDKSRIITCTIPKCAQSWIATALSQYIALTLPHSLQFTPTDYYKIYRNDYSLVLFVRNPISRIASALPECFLHTRSYYREDGLPYRRFSADAVQEELGVFKSWLSRFSTPRSVLMCMDDFKDDINKTDYNTMSDIYANAHTRPQIHSLGGLYYDDPNITWFEVNSQLSENFEHWCKTTKKRLPQYYSSEAVNTSKTNLIKLAALTYTKEVWIPANLDTITEFYKHDIAHYNYIKPYCYTKDKY